MRGREILNDPLRNRGTAFTLEERETLGLTGLLPPAVETQEEQVERVLRNCRRKTSDLEKYIFLMALLDQNETLFYRTVMDHLREFMPIIYTPTVGEAAKQFAHIFRRPRGLYISADHRGRVAEVLRSWSRPDVRVIVATDGERILGLGDLGANGMSIPIGKLSLYTAAGGIPPRQTLPILLDVGTNNAELRGDGLYLGLNQPRMTGDAYLEFLDEFVEAVQEVHPRALIQFEDFSTANAYRLLDRYRDRACVMNDDIQGTAAVGLAGIYAAMRILETPLSRHRILFLGAGAAATGIADLFVRGVVDEGTPEEEARRMCWFMNSGGLVVESRTDLKIEELRPYAHPHEPVTGLVEALRTLRPSILIGATGAPGTFGPEVLRAMGEINERPVVFALSNPTSKAECTAEEAYRHTGGRVLFASGSPFEPVEAGGATLVPGQANNVYAFPGIGLGVVAAGSTRVTDRMFLAASRALARAVSPEDLARGTLFPPLEEIRRVSLAIAVETARLAQGEGLLRSELPPDAEGSIAEFMYQPVYA